MTKVRNDQGTQIRGKKGSTKQQGTKIRGLLSNLLNRFL